jgi:hypothetical protein
VARGATVVRAADEVVRDGWRFDLEGFARRVYVDVHERHDPDGSLARIAATFGDDGVASLDDALDELRWGPVYAALDDVVAAWLAGTAIDEAWATFVAAAVEPAGAATRVPTPSGAARSRVRTAAAKSPEGAVAAAYAYLVGHLPDALGTWRRGRFARALERRLAREGAPDAASWSAAAEATLADRGVGGAGGRPDAPAAAIERWSCDAAAVGALGVHEHAGVRWFRAEGLTALADVAALVARWRSPGGGNANAWQAWRRSLEASARAAGYDVDAWRAAARSTVAKAAEAADPSAAGRAALEPTSGGPKAAGATGKGSGTSRAGAKGTGAKGTAGADRRSAQERAANEEARAKRARGTPKKTHKAPKG